MRELGLSLGEGPPDEPVTDPNGSTRVRPEAVRRMDLRRSRQALFGTGVHPEAALFATRLARAVGEAATPAFSDPGRATDPGGVDRYDDGLLGAPGPDDGRDEFGDPGGRTGDWWSRETPRVLPALRDAVFGDGGLGDRSPGAGGGAVLGPAFAPPAGPDTVRLPLAPALVCDRADRVVRGLGDGRSDAELTAAVLVELGDAAAVPPGGGRDPDRSWTAELERLAGVGTWSYELATGTLHRSETLDELYRSVGLDPEIGGAPVEGDQVALLCDGLRAGVHSGDHHAQLRLPGDRRLSCRAEVECAPDGTPLRLVGVVRDLTAQRAAEERVRHSGQRFADLMALMPGGVALLDPAGRVVDANDGLCALLDAPLERLRGISAGVLDADLPADVRDGTMPGWLRAVPPGAQFGYRIEAAPLRRGDGTTVWCELAVSATSADDGAWFWLVVCSDISERRRAAELLRRAGTVDELTRLPNRAASIELVDRLLAGPGRERVAVVCGDLDDFARVNSSLGHEAGDELLVTLAARLQRELPVGCTAARLSGDEFVVICADHAEVGGPDQFARLVAGLLRTTITVRGRPVQMTASVGIATPVPTGELRAADLLRFAEVAMHDVKRRQCRGGIGTATDGVVSSATRALELEAELKAAIAADGLVLDYQPVVGPDGTVLSAEALVRWPHPERGLIAPNDFLPVAQRSGLLRELDLWVLRTAVREAATWPEHRGRLPAVAVNLAGLLPGDVGFLSAVTEAVEVGGLPWDRLVLELVETSLVALPPDALAAMAELVERGVRFAVDDFGTGYSSLARLKELPAQTVKVDRAFVTGIAEDPADFAVARAVVDMSRAMGRTTVAEGVETAEQFHVLRGIGVDAYQGWLFARPLPAAALRELLAGGRLATPATRAVGL